MIQIFCDTVDVVVGFVVYVDIKVLVEVEVEVVVWVVVWVWVVAMGSVDDVEIVIGKEVETVEMIVALDDSLFALVIKESEVDIVLDDAILGLTGSVIGKV